MVKYDEIKRLMRIEIVGLIAIEESHGWPCHGFSMTPWIANLDEAGREGVDRAVAEIKKEILIGSNNETDIPENQPSECNHHYYIYPFYHYEDNDRGHPEIVAVSAKCRCCGDSGPSISSNVGLAVAFRRSVELFIKNDSK